MVDTLEHYAFLLKHITVSAFGEGEHAGDLRHCPNFCHSPYAAGVVECAA